MPTSQIASPRVLDFTIEGNTSAVGRGAYYWALGLPDGREVTAWADRVDVLECGAIVLWQDNVKFEEMGEDGPEIRREPLEPPRPTMVLAGGSWTHCYAASVFDDAPVAVDHLPGPNRDIVADDAAKWDNRS